MKLKHWIDQHVFPFWRIRIGIPNIIRWFPIIWKDQQWDHTFLLDILRKKLELMEPFFRENARHVGTTRNANQIKLCIDLLNRIRADEYFDNAFKRHDKKWGPSRYFTIPYAGDDNLLEIKFDRPLVTAETKKIEDKESKVCINHIRYMEEQDFDLLFCTMRKRLRSWWD